MLEADQFIHASGGQLRQAGGVELLSRNGEHDVAGVDQRCQDYRHPFRFKPTTARVHVFQPMVVLDDLAAVDHLAMALGPDGVEDELGVLGFVGIDLFAVEQFQGIQYGRGLLGAVRSRDGPQGVLRGLGAVVAGDQDREERVVLGLIGEVRRQADPGNGVDQVAEVDGFVGRDSGQPTDSAHFFLCPGAHGLCLALVGDFKGIHDVRLQPLDQLFQKTVGLGFVGGLGVARGGGGKVQRGGIVFQRGLELLVDAFQAEEDLVTGLVILELGRIVGLDEIEVEVPLRHGGGALVGSAEEKVADTGGLAFLPGQFMLPDLVTAHIGGVLAFHDPLERLVVEAVELSLAEAFGPLVDQGVEIVGLFQVEIELVVVRIEGDELAADGFVDLAQDGFHMGLQVLVGFIAAQLGDQRIEQAEAVAQFRG